MSTAIHFHGLHPALQKPGHTEREGFWRSLLKREIEARTRRGEARVRQHVSRFSDEALANLGLSADEIVALRATGRIPLRTAC